MTDTTTGGCLCGATRYTVASPARFAIVCFCGDCQKVSGAGHAPQLGVTGADLAVEGPLKVYRRKADSGSDLEFGFCSDCGSPLTKRTSRAPDLAFLYAGSLDDPAGFREAKPVFEQSRLPWDRF